jgi:hypothetical protein
MAEKLSLSRERFYQLQKAGIFPPPVYSIVNKRPFYTCQQQDNCLEIKKTGIGFNGKPVIFNNPRKQIISSHDNNNGVYENLMTILKRMGLKITKKMLTNAMSRFYPGGLKENDINGTKIKELFNYLKQNT